MGLKMVRPDQPADDGRGPRATPVFAVRPHRDVVTVEGPDAVAFLQGQVSQDIAALAVGEQTWTLLLQPQGKVEAWLHVSRQADDRVVLDVDAGFGDAVVTRLQRFLIRTKATIEVTDRDVIVDPTTAGQGEAERIAAGVPAMGAELTEHTIPAEVGQWFIDASVSFTKGCYTGQELVARIDSRGNHVPRHLRVLTVADRVVVPTDAEVVVDDAVVGTITSSTDGVALAYVKRSVELPAAATVRWDGGDASAAIAAPPGD